LWQSVGRGSSAQDEEFNLAQLRGDYINITLKRKLGFPFIHSLHKILREVERESRSQEEKNWENG